MAKKKAKAEENFIGCLLKKLPADLLQSAAATAFSENPANRPDPIQVLAVMRATETVEADLLGFTAVLTTKYWGNKGVKLGVYFMDTQDTTLKNKILAYMNRWRTANPKGANITFTEASRGLAQVRIARTRGEGYFSYLGTDVLHIPVDDCTMNLDSFSLSTPESEYARVVCHETGHTLGFPHEHMRASIINRLDRTAVINYFMTTQGWTQQDVIQQVLTPLDESKLIATPTDETSIMTYQLPASLTKDGRAIPGGKDINAQDYDFVTKIYPPTTVVVPPTDSGKVRIVLDYDEKTNVAGVVSVTPVG